jgi:integrase
MKSGASDEVIEPHRVPLVPQAMAILRAAYSFHAGREISLEELPRLATLKGNALIFATPRDPKKPLSDNGTSKIIRDMNENQDPPPWRDNDGRPAVPHGFRASFRTWVDDIFPTEIKAAEAALGHREGNQVVAAYARSDVFERRIPLIQAWADHCHHAPTPVATMPVISPSRQAR